MVSPECFPCFHFSVTVYTFKQDKLDEIQTLQSVEPSPTDSGDQSGDNQKLVGECEDLKNKLLDTEQLLQERSDQLDAVNKQKNKDDITSQQVLSELQLLTTQYDRRTEEVDSMLEEKKQVEDEKMKAVNEVMEQLSEKIKLLESEKMIVADQEGKIKELSSMLQTLEGDLVNKNVQLQNGGDGEKNLLEQKNKEIDRLKQERIDEQEQMKTEIEKLMQDLSDKNQELKHLTLEVANNHDRAQKATAGVEQVKKEFRRELEEKNRQIAEYQVVSHIEIVEQYLKSYWKG